jgi:hypothetical protein
MQNNYSNQSRLDALESQIIKLSDSLRFWKRVSTAAIVLILGSFFMGQNPPPKNITAGRVTADKVTTKSLRIVGPGNKLRGLVSVTKKGNAALSLMDVNQKVRASYTVSNNGSQKLSFLNDDGSLRMVLGTATGGNPSLILNDETNTTRVTVTAVPPALICNNAQGKAKVVIAVNKAGVGVIKKIK